MPAVEPDRRLSQPRAEQLQRLLGDNVDAPQAQWIAAREIVRPAAGREGQLDAGLMCAGLDTLVEAAVRIGKRGRRSAGLAFQVLQRLADLT